MVIIKQCRPGSQKNREGIKVQLAQLERNLAIIETLLNERPNRAVLLSTQQLIKRKITRSIKFITHHHS